MDRKGLFLVLFIFSLLLLGTFITKVLARLSLCNTALDSRHMSVMNMLELLKIFFV